MKFQCITSSHASTQISRGLNTVCYSPWITYFTPLEKALEPRQAVRSKGRSIEDDLTPLSTSGSYGWVTTSRLLRPTCQLTGALLSGCLRIAMNELADNPTLTQLKVRLHLQENRRFENTARTAPHTLKSWPGGTFSSNFFSSRAELVFLLSYLFPDHLPASCNRSLRQVEYFLQVHAQNNAGDDFLNIPLHLRRALLPPTASHPFIRSFQPLRRTWLRERNLWTRVVLYSIRSMISIIYILRNLAPLYVYRIGSKESLVLGYSPFFTVWVSSWSV